MPCCMRHVMPCFSMICHAILCYMPCYSMLYHAFLCYIPYHAKLIPVMPCFSMLYHDMPCSSLFCHAFLCFTMPRHAILPVMLCFSKIYAKPFHVMPCFLRYATSYTAIWYAMLFYAMTRCSMLCNAMSCHAMLLPYIQNYLVEVNFTRRGILFNQFACSAQYTGVTGQNGIGQNGTDKMVRTNGSNFYSGPRTITIQLNWIFIQ